MQKRDYYAILGVARDADANQIRMAYRKMAFRNHPDTNSDDPHAEDRFKEINEAYDVLSHRDKRDRYDLGLNPLTGGSPFRSSPFNPWMDSFETNFFPGFQCRGGGLGRALGRNRRMFRGSGAGPAGFARCRSDAYTHDLDVTPDEAFRGAERDLRFHTGRDTLVFTVSIPAGVQNGTLLTFRHPIRGGQEIEFLFRVRIAE